MPSEKLIHALQLLIISIRKNIAVEGKQDLCNAQQFGCLSMLFHTHKSLNSRGRANVTTKMRSSTHDKCGKAC